MIKVVSGQKGIVSGVNSLSLQASEKEEVVETICHERLKKNVFQGGKEGRPVDLLSNFFKLDTSEKLVFHYVFDIQKVFYKDDGGDGEKKGGDYAVSKSPGFEKFLKNFGSTIMNLLIKNNEEVFGQDVGVVHDGYSKLYSTNELKLNLLPDIHRFEIAGKASFYSIRLTLNAEVDLTEITDFYSNQSGSKGISQTVLAVIEQVFSHLVQQRFARFQRGFFSFTHREASKNRALQLVRGFTTAVRMTEFGLALNVHSNQSSAVISQLTPTVDRFVQTYLGLDKLGLLSEEQLKQASKLLRGLKVKTTHTGEEQTFTIDCLSTETPTSHTFKSVVGEDGAAESTGGVVSVREHFQRRYNISLLQRNLVKTTVTKRGGSGSGSDYKIHLPMEVCSFVANQFISECKLPLLVHSELIRLSSSPPNHYFAEIVHFARLIAEINPRLLAQFGIQLSTRPAKVPARVLDLPPLLGNNTGTFYRVAEPPEQWAVICCDLSVTQTQLNAFIASLRDVAQGRGLKLGKPFPSSIERITDVYFIFNCFDNLRILTRVSFVLFIIPSYCTDLPNSEIYNAVKYFSDSEVDFISQCVRGEKAKAPPKGYFENLLDKINVKIGGVNTVVSQDYLTSLLPFEVKETMLVGVDVNHPGQSDKIAVSIAAAVGSVDPSMSSYCCSVRVQEKFHNETVEAIGEMVATLVLKFKELNRGVLPRNIIIFRDGTDDGHLGRLEAEEIAPLEAAVRKHVPGARFAFIVVQKSHSVRFGLTKVNVASGSTTRPTFNVEPGTVVDSFVIDPTMENMYLNSHFSYLGTSKPSRYLVLRDDFSLTADQLEKVCFLACHNCARTRKPISMPVPIRYAHLCALRAMLHVKALDFIDSDFITASSSSDGSGWGAERRAVKVEKLAKCIENSKVNCKKLYYV